MSWIEGVIVALILTILGLLAAPAVVRVRAHNVCLAHGFPETSLAFPLKPYCVKRVNQTDSVVALKDIK